MANHPIINVEIRTTWIVLAIKLGCWMKSRWLLKMIKGAILFRTYVNGKLLSEFRLDINDL